MTDRRGLAILSLLNENEYITSRQLAQSLNLSDRTVRTAIAGLQVELKNTGASLVSRHRYGYILEINDRRKFSEWLKSAEKENGEKLPDSSEERQRYIIMHLLMRMTPVKANELCDFLHVSERSLSNDLKHIHELLKGYDLYIEARPYKGMRLVGTELMKRRCMIDLVLSGDHEDSIFQTITRILGKLLKEDQIRLSESEFASLCGCLYASHLRCLQSMYIEIEEDEASALRKNKEYETAARLMEKMNRAGLMIPQGHHEQEYITLFLLGNSVHTVRNNTVITEKEKHLADVMMKAVYKTYHIPVHEDASLKLALYEHVIPMMIRLQYNIPYENPMLKQIRAKYILAYQMAQVAAIPVRDIMQKEISEDEIACLALIFQTGLESNRQRLQRNVLLVSRRIHTDLYYLRLRIMEEFSGSITLCGSCTPEEFETYDLNGIDCIFSTEAITRPVRQPICLLDDEFNAGNIESLRRRIRYTFEETAERFFSPDLFFADIDAKDRDDALKKLCALSAQFRSVSDDFAQSVLNRENRGSSAYGNLLAVPHPHHRQKDSFVSIGILKQSVLFDEDSVQIIFLVSQGNAQMDEMYCLYHMINIFARSKDRIADLLNRPEYEQLISVLCR